MEKNGKEQIRLICVHRKEVKSYQSVLQTIHKSVESRNSYNKGGRERRQGKSENKSVDKKRGRGARGRGRSMIPSNSLFLSRQHTGGIYKCDLL